MKVSVQALKPKLPKSEFDLSDNATVADLKKAFGKKFPKFGPDRQRLTLPVDGSDKPVVLDDRKTLSSYGVKDGGLIQFKDLGPQIGYDTVFYIEYFGPILFHALFFYFPEVFYGPNNFLHSILPSVFYGGEIVEKTLTQKIVFLMVVAHFLKREFETAFVHKFSHATMPLFNLFKNCSHYWMTCGVLVGYTTYIPGLWSNTNSTLLYVSIFLYTFAEISNLLTHVNLSTLRPAGTTERRIPYGYGFSWVSCPNYFFETLAWTAVILLIPSLSSAFFLITSAGQMYLWALKKHSQYKKEFPNYPRGRKVMFPYVL